MEKKERNIMQNTINNVSFQANLKPLTKIKNKSAFVEAKNIFTDATKNYPNDSLYITRNSLGETVIYLSDSLSNYANKNLGTKNIDKQIDEMGVDKFAEKLIKIFKALKMHEETSGKLTTLRSKIFRLTKLMELNNHAAYNWASEGKNSIANRYTVLARNNQGKIDQLKSEEQKIANEFNGNIEDLSKQYNELIQLKI